MDTITKDTPGVLLKTVVGINPDLTVKGIFLFTITCGADYGPCHIEHSSNFSQPIIITQLGFGYKSEDMSLAKLANLAKEIEDNVLKRLNEQVRMRVAWASDVKKKLGEL